MIWAITVTIWVLDPPSGHARDAAPPSGPEQSDQEPSEPQTLAYTIRIETPEDTPDALRDGLEAASRLVTLQDDPPFSHMGLRRRIEEDVSRFTQLLRGEGFYAASVDSALQLASTAPLEPAKDSDNDTTDPAAADVVIRVNPGPRYRISQVLIDYTGSPGPSTPSQPLPNGFAALGLTKDDPARSASILPALNRLVTTLTETGYPLAEITDRRFVVDHRNQSMSVSLTVNSGPEAAFGAVTLTGLTDVERAYADRLRPWEDGDRYSSKKVAEYRKALSETRLFDAIKAAPADTVGADGRIGVDITVREAKHRTIGLGGRYDTSLGPELQARWEHRNLFGQGEQLTGTLLSGLKQQQLEGSFRKPFLFGHDQDLIISTDIARQQFDTYNALTVDGLGALERPFWDHWRGQIGVAGELTRITDHETFGNVSIGLIGLPLSATRDDTDDVLDPTEGTRLTLVATPWVGKVGEADTGFLEMTGRLSGYVAPFSSNDTVFAAWAELGSVFGAAFRTVPPNHRLFGGGGGSVRAFGFQKISPLDDTDDPLGGLSNVSVGIEARIKVTNTIGIVPFLEAGSVSTDSIPDPFNGDGELLFGGGLGVRYYTDFGPIRADIAVPFNPRDDVDDLFQFYISIGQAF